MPWDSYFRTLHSGCKNHFKIWLINFTIMQNINHVTHPGFRIDPEYCFFFHLHIIDEVIVTTRYKGWGRKAILVALDKGTQPNHVVIIV